MQAKIVTGKQRFNSGFIAGLGAGIIASSLMLILSALLSGISLPEVLGSAITQLMPPAVFQSLHQLIGADAKLYLFYIILIGQCLVFGLIGGLCNLGTGWSRLSWIADDQGQIHWPVAILLAFVLWLLTCFVFLPLTGAGVFGSALTIGVFNTTLSLAIVGLAFSWVFIYIQNWQIQHRLPAADFDDGLEEKRLARRNALRTGLTVIGVGTLGVLAWRFITSGVGGTAAGVSNLPALQKFKSKIVPPPKPKYGTIEPVAHLSAEVTPNDQYYVVSKNLASDPTVNADGWGLRVYGDVQQPFTLTYAQLLALPMKQQYESMMCISNEVGGPYMSNAQWEGVPLLDLLTRAGVKPGASKVVLHAADDYADSIHLTKALEPTTLIAVRMNGVTLPNGHGFPARLLVPGIYGMKHVKWMTGIEVVNTDFQGFWQQRGWSDPAPIRMTSRIDTPLDSAKLAANRPTYIAGVAFSGNQGISEVDVSFDGGQTWHVATLKRPLSMLTWVLWELPWQPKAGTHTITVRAIDLQGNVQNPIPASPAPNGSSGYHTLTVTVA
jgi:DMSO/TMAO reductase YedYZ molybdopterin-dependent catalytic subunit